MRAVSTIRRAVPNPHASDNAPRADHLFVVSGWTRAPGPNGFLNWLSDDFAVALGDDAVVVQDAALDRLTSMALRPSNPRTYSYARAGERVSRRSARHALSATDRARVETSLREAFKSIDHPVTDQGRERAIADVLGRADRARHSQREFARLLDRVKPRRIYMQTAAYGTRAADIALARRQGIEVAELQHGWMGSSHAAYNFGALMREPEFERCLPDTILGYGDFWGRDISFPGRFIAIGKPTLDPSTLDVPDWASRPRRVLFVSSNYEHPLVDRAVVALADALPHDWTVAIRPHPVERATAAHTHSSSLMHDRVELDLSADAAAALASSRAVVGFSSTMLFEALANGCHVGVVESPLAEHYADASVFPLRIAADLSNVPAVAQRLQTEPTAVETQVSESVWKKGAVRSFADFARA
jgi:hypothetical protein